MSGKSSPLGMLTRGKAAIMLAVAAVLLPVLVFGISQNLLMLAVLTALEGVAAGAIVVAAGGYGYALMCPVLGEGHEAGPLRAVTSAAVGLWLLSVAIMLAGSLIPGALTLWVWWPVIAVGVVLAAWQGRKSMERWKLPESFDGRFVAWMAVALAGGLWVAGASQPVGYWLRFSEASEVLHRQMQLPAEFFQAGRISSLEHNCYSYGPMGTEMLFLLGMVLRGGAKEGMYLARYLSIATAALAMLGIFLSLGKDRDLRGRLAVVLLVTTPLVMRMAWLARADLMRLSMLALALLWLRHWMKGGSWRAAACAGVVLGIACTTGYDAVWLLAVPVLVVMVLAGAMRPSRLGHLAATVLAILVIVAPWLIRTAALAGGNPVFPMATKALGRAHWSADEQQRWISAHSVPPGAPAPLPPGYEPVEMPRRADMLYYRLIAYSASEKVGLVTLAIALVSLCALVAMRKPDPWDWMLVAAVGALLVAWVFGTPAMLPSQLVPMMVPVCLLAAGGLARFANLEKNPFSRRADRPASGPWGAGTVAAVTSAAVLINLIIAYGVFRASVNGLAPPGAMIAASQTAPQNPMRMLLIGNAEELHPPLARFSPYYSPPASLYATPFDDNPLAKMIRRGLTPDEIFTELKMAGITHVAVCWPAVWAQAGDCGYPEVLSTDLQDRAASGQVAGLKILNDLSACGLRLVEAFPEGAATQPASRPATMPATSPASAPWRIGSFPRSWPVISVYALPRPETQPATQSQAASD